MGRMTKSEFNRRIKATRLTSRAIPAAREVLIGGNSIYEAARSNGVSYPVLWRVVDRIRKVSPCPVCGQDLRGRHVATANH